MRDKVRWKAIGILAMIYLGLAAAVYLVVIIGGLPLFDSIH